LAKKQAKSEDGPEPSFEETLEQLEAIVQQLEEGKIGLNEALARYEEGVKLLRHCYGLLEGAERRIELLSGVDAEGNPVTTPLDDEALSLDEKARSRSRRRTAPDGPGPPSRGDSGAGENDVDGSGGLF
jgi:exodeoxyribonuclease VII small subunit